MDNHSKKLIAPIVITVIIVLYYAGFTAVCLFLPISAGFKLALGLVPLLLIGVCIYCLRERIKEIRSGEEDDLSKY